MHKILEKVTNLLLRFLIISCKKTVYYDYPLVMRICGDEAKRCSKT